MTTKPTPREPTQSDLDNWRDIITKLRSRTSHQVFNERVAYEMERMIAMYDAAPVPAAPADDLVARARKEFYEDNCKTCSLGHELADEIERLRAALSGECSDAMLRAALDVWHSDIRGANEYARDVWRVMANAALAQEGK